MPMSPEERKAALRVARLSYAQLGRRLRPPVSKAMVAAQMNELPRQKSARVRRAIARAIGLPYEEVWAA